MKILWGLYMLSESILKHFFTEIGENVIKVEDIIGAVENRRTAA